jgi:hypothetical protein
MGKPKVLVLDVQLTSFMWKPASGREIRAEEGDTILVPRPGLADMLQQSHLPVVFYTDGDPKTMRRPLNDALYRMGFDGYPYHFCAAFVQGKSYGKFLKLVADDFRVKPEELLFFGDTALSTIDVSAAESVCAPFVHVPCSEWYSHAPMNVLREVGFHNLPLRKPLESGFNGQVLDFRYEGEKWVPELVTYQNVIRRCHEESRKTNGQPMDEHFFQEHPGRLHHLRVH